ncbi:hypothetical protein ACHQM5_021484 [Ranunculus cassubicifolius]
MDYLRILDLGENKFSGSIPRCYGNFRAMKVQSVEKPFRLDNRLDDYEDVITQVMKGKAREYNRTLKYLANLDLSSNLLVGQIPEDLTSLRDLRGFNLSNNQLKGRIPESIGNLKSLESLDLSQNHLSGMIPRSISELYSLGYLNLSYNNLSGQIPDEDQLQTFDASSFEGNRELCGRQVERNCTKEKQFTPSDSGIVQAEKEKDTWFYIGVIMGFVIGFWIVYGILFFRKTWRYAYFRFVEDTYDRLSVMIIVRLSWLQQIFK